MSSRQIKKLRKGRNHPNNRERTVTTLTEDPNSHLLVPMPSEEPPGATISARFSSSSSPVNNRSSLPPQPPPPPASMPPPPLEPIYQVPGGGFGPFVAYGSPFPGPIHGPVPHHYHHLPSHQQHLLQQQHFFTHQPQPQGTIPLQQQQQQHQNNYQQHQHSHPQQQPLEPLEPLEPVQQPPGKNDLDILDNLKSIIRAGQHDTYKAVPQPAALARVFLGTTPDSSSSNATPASASTSVQASTSAPAATVASTAKPQAQGKRQDQVESQGQGSGMGRHPPRLQHKEDPSVATRQRRQSVSSTPLGSGLAHSGAPGSGLDNTHNANNLNLTNNNNNNQNYANGNDSQRGPHHPPPSPSGQAPTSTRPLMGPPPLPPYVQAVANGQQAVSNSNGVSSSSSMSGGEGPGSAYDQRQSQGQGQRDPRNGHPTSPGGAFVTSSSYNSSRYDNDVRGRDYKYEHGRGRGADNTWSAPGVVNERSRSGSLPPPRRRSHSPGPPASRQRQDSLSVSVMTPTSAGPASAPAWTPNGGDKTFRREDPPPHREGNNIAGGYGDRENNNNDFRGSGDISRARDISLDMVRDNRARYRDTSTRGRSMSRDRGRDDYSSNRGRGRPLPPPPPPPFSNRGRERSDSYSYVRDNHTHGYNTRRHFEPRFRGGSTRPPAEQRHYEPDYRDRDERPYYRMPPPPPPPSFPSRRYSDARDDNVGPGPSSGSGSVPDGADTRERRYSDPRPPAATPVTAPPRTRSSASYQDRDNRPDGYSRPIGAVKVTDSESPRMLVDSPIPLPGTDTDTVIARDDVNTPRPLAVWRNIVRTTPGSDVVMDNAFSDDEVRADVVMSIEDHQDASTILSPLGASGHPGPGPGQESNNDTLETEINEPTTVNPELGESGRNNRGSSPDSDFQAFYGHSGDDAAADASAMDAPRLQGEYTLEDEDSEQKEYKPMLKDRISDPSSPSHHQHPAGDGQESDAMIQRASLEERISDGPPSSPLPGSVALVKTEPPQQQPKQPNNSGTDRDRDHDGYIAVAGSAFPPLPPPRSGGSDFGDRRDGDRGSSANQDDRRVNERYGYPQRMSPPPPPPRSAYHPRGSSVAVSMRQDHRRGSRDFSPMPYHPYRRRDFGRGPPPPHHHHGPPPRGRSISRERPGASYRSNERGSGGYGPPDRDRSTDAPGPGGLPLYHPRERYGRVVTMPYDRPFSPPTAAHLANDRVRAQQQHFANYSSSSPAGPPPGGPGGSSGAGSGPGPRGFGPPSSDMPPPPGDRRYPPDFGIDRRPPRRDWGGPPPPPDGHYAPRQFDSYTGGPQPHQDRDEPRGRDRFRRDSDPPPPPPMRDQDWDPRDERARREPYGVSAVAAAAASRAFNGGNRPLPVHPSSSYPSRTSSPFPDGPPPMRAMSMLPERAAVRQLPPQVPFTNRIRRRSLSPPSGAGAQTPLKKSRIDGYDGKNINDGNPNFHTGAGATGSRNRSPAAESMSGSGDPLARRRQEFRSMPMTRSETVPPMMSGVADGVGGYYSNRNDVPSGPSGSHHGYRGFAPPFGRSRSPGRPPPSFGPPRGHHRGGYGPRGRDDRRYFNNHPPSMPPPGRRP